MLIIYRSDLFTVDCQQKMQAGVSVCGDYCPELDAAPAVDGGIAAMESLLGKLANVPTPAGPTPRELQNKRTAWMSRRVYERGRKTMRGRSLIASLLSRYCGAAEITKRPSSIA